ncbi:hypothetical protein PDR5_24170 [Pseudomonas sp. DR 5-09]|nr:hypothetical protein PDR5_24170 [Pseudomonas sp. DR 5-09]
MQSPLNKDAPSDGTRPSYFGVTRGEYRPTLHTAMGITVALL